LNRSRQSLATKDTLDGQYDVLNVAAESRE
jgi:hypothetical protein